MKALKDRELYVKPAAAVTVINPETGHPISSEGAAVPNNKYWRRRLNDGDVTEATPPAAAKKTSK